MTYTARLCLHFYVCAGDAASHRDHADAGCVIWEVITEEKRKIRDLFASYSARFLCSDVTSSEKLQRLPVNTLVVTLTMCESVIKESSYG